MLKDIDIREALVKKLEKENKIHEYRIINEMAVCDGDSRVDIAVANGKLCGYEIKSDRDTLERLPKQIEAYNKTFDKVTIIVGEKFEDKIKGQVPDWWGIEVAYQNRLKKVSFRKVRSSKLNRDVNPHSILELLWKEELLILLKENNIKGISNKNRKKLRDIAVDAISLEKLRNYTRETLKFREGWRAD